jgi:hypothetical protein
MFLIQNNRNNFLVYVIWYKGKYNSIVCNNFICDYFYKYKTSGIIIFIEHKNVYLFFNVENFYLNKHSRTCEVLCFALATQLGGKPQPDRFERRKTVSSLSGCYPRGTAILRGASAAKLDKRG